MFSTEQQSRSALQLAFRLWYIYEGLRAVVTILRI